MSVHRSKNDKEQTRGSSQLNIIFFLKKPNETTACVNAIYSVTQVLLPSAHNYTLHHDSIHFKQILREAVHLDNNKDNFHHTLNSR